MFIKMNRGPDLFIAVAIGLGLGYLLTKKISGELNSIGISIADNFNTNTKLFELLLLNIDNNVDGAHDDLMRAFITSYTKYLMICTGINEVTITTLIYQSGNINYLVDSGKFDEVLNCADYLRVCNISENYINSFINDWFSNEIEVHSRISSDIGQRSITSSQ